MSDTSAPELVACVRSAALAIQRKDWEQGMVAQAFLEAGDLDTAAQLCRAALIYQLGDGRIACIQESGSGLVDSAMLGEALLKSAQRHGDANLVQAESRLRDWIAHRAPRSSVDGTLYHVPEQMWVDSYNAAPPYLAAAGEIDAALAQLAGLRRRLWREEKQLFSHIWDEARAEFADASCWGVGNGWAASGMARVIRTLHTNYPERDQDKVLLIRQLIALLDGCLAHQRAEDALFYNVLDDPATFVETNAAQMLAYALYTGLAGGWLPDPDARYRSAADRMRAAARSKVDEHGFVQGVCGAPQFDCPSIAAEGQAYFLLMESAAALA